ncbi:MAG: chromosomal replication initiator protein DnaA [Candidatus Magasanikbacteria bacterium CG_4_9_14_3_um_filter_32_9]|uniref:Chromosomal replication initiator protein DnaA n=1 Tax=Candidatus Magasanikbacteria bacterium CG_4_9_14_3_um_filter_32_9 TaxID=1974644 RepID=A0A2M7Z793_9BACT|nr:MAG: chromosomal replication initiator protein DnaA [Candidatus Magasanikbacteria bacterium CG_4_9_14_3_um_filter_32_9]
MNNHEIWQAILAEFELKISKANFITWFGDTGIVNYDAGHVEVCVPNQFTKSWLEKKYHSELVRLLEKVTQKPIRKVTYVVDSLKNIQKQNPEVENSPQRETRTQQPQNFSTQTFNVPPVQKTFTPSMLPMDGHSFSLNPKYSFESFVIGKNNELAHAAANAVSMRPGEAYNPLFIYGGVGLGKTHLLQAIAHSMLRTNPNTKFLYVTSEKFTNDFISAVQQRRITNFKEKYRNVDLLLIDDIQFIGGKEQTQEEFFHTFNELHQNRRQVVLTSDRPPKDIASLADRLKSRFEWGMIADISAPDLETRVAILQSKCLEKNFSLTDEILQMVAEAVQSNIRELEGALNKIIAFHELKNIFPTLDSVKSVVLSLKSIAVKTNLTAKDLIDTVAEFYNLNPADILEKSRSRHISFPRQIIMYLLRVEMTMSYPSIGNTLGGRDHTTAMHAHNKINKSLETDEKLKQEIDLIKQRLYSNE